MTKCSSYIYNLYFCVHFSDIQSNLNQITGHLNHASSGEKNQVSSLSENTKVFIHNYLKIFNMQSKRTSKSKSICRSYYTKQGKDINYTFFSSNQGQLVTKDED